MNRHEFIAASVLSKRKGPDGKLLFDPHGKSFKEIGRFFEDHITPQERKAFDVLLKSTIDLNVLNTGRKGITELLDEVRKGEAFLLLNEKGEVVRFAESLQIYLRYRNWWLREQWRHYRKRDATRSLFYSGHTFLRRIFYHFIVSYFVGIQKEYGLSETRIKGEDTDTTTLMAILEELGFSLTAAEIAGILIDRSQQVTPHWHPSSAYVGVTSCVLAIRMLVTLDHMRWRLFFGKVIQDTRIEIYAKWRYSRKMPRGDWEPRQKWRPWGEHLEDALAKAERDFAKTGIITGEQLKLLLLQKDHSEL